MKKVLCVLLSIVMLCGLFAGCGVKDDPTILEIEFTKAGYGEEFFDELVKAFKAKTGIEVKTNKTVDQTVSATKLGTGPKNCSYDLFFSISDVFHLVENYRGKYGYDNLFQDMTELYNMEVPGKNGKTLKQIVKPDLYNLHKTYKDEQFFVPWGATMEGLIYNKKVLDNYGVSQLPRTTEEWFEILEQIKNQQLRSSDGVLGAKNSVPAAKRTEAGITYAGTSGYWTFVWPMWWAQYQGMENYQKFFTGTADNAVEGDLPSWEVNKQQGKLEAIKVMEKALVKTNGYIHPNAVEQNHTDSQIYFLEGKAAFIPNGDWLETESAKNYPKGSVDFRFMRLPIVSALGTKLGLSENKLRETVTYVDELFAESTTAVKPSGVTEAQIEEVKKARGIVNSNISYTLKMFMPSYSNAKDKAYQFILFFASEEGQEIFCKYSGNVGAFDYNPLDNQEIKDNLSPFSQSMYELLTNKNSKLLAEYKNHPIRFYGGLNLTAHKENIDPAKGFEALLYQGSKTAQEVFDYDVEFYKNKWEDILVKAGLVAV